MSGITLQKLREELDEINEAIKTLRLNGQQHSLAGSHSFTGVGYKDLLRERRVLERRIMSMNGGKAYTIPDFSEDGKYAR